MKKLCIVLLLLLIVLQSYAPGPNKEILEKLKKDYEITVKEQYHIKVLKAFIAVEKPKTPLQAVEAKKRENAVGILQIRPIAVREVNRIVGSQKYFLHDRLDSLKSVEMFYIIQDYWNPTFDLKKACYIWNGGGNYHSKNAKKLDKYYKLITKELNKMK